MYACHVLEWTFSPSDFFGDLVELSGTGYEIRIENGKIEARVQPDHYPKDHSLRDTLQTELDARFQAVQVVTHRAFELSRSNLTSIDADGRKHRRMFADCGSYLVVGQTVDFVLVDSDGNVKKNSKHERRIRQQQLADLAAKHVRSNAVVRAILNSYTAAVGDPQNELVHLYEIREALARHLGGEAAVQATTGVSNAQWSRFGRLANHEPLLQGRHRGQQIGGLRDATEEELNEARKFAQDLIEGFLRSLT
jgi:hypothetical protein